MNFDKKIKIRIILASVTTATFVIAFVLNITSDQALYNADLNVVPSWQNDKSKAFIIFMNIISNIFNPVICAGYVALFWLISSKKMQILVFLVWFIFVSWLLTILKLIIQQPRPYWIQGSGIKMLEWTCYSQFGCPSGHSMLGLILMEFIVRFIVRSFRKAKKVIWLLYLIMIVLQILVMFSRVILGMHTFNQVLMGLMLGIYLISIYYIYFETIILRYLLILLTTKRKMLHTFILILAMILFFVFELLLQFLPSYDNTAYFNVIEATSGCSKVKYYKSFQYKCLEDSALIMADFGIIISLIFMEHPQNFARPMEYSKCSLKYLFKILIMIISAVIPVAIFLNPLWTQITTDTTGLTLIIWSTQNFGFFFAIVMIIFVGLYFSGKANLQLYGQCQYIVYLKRQKDNLFQSQPQIQLTPEGTKKSNDS